MFFIVAASSTFSSIALTFEAHLLIFPVIKFYHLFRGRVLYQTGSVSKMYGKVLKYWVAMG